MRIHDTLTAMQTSMIVALCYHEKGRGLGDLLPLQVTRQFFAEALLINRWQSYHTDLLNRLVVQGWLKEHAASHGTIFYSLTPEGRITADDVIDRANRFAFAFVPQTATLFDLTEEK